MRVAVIGLGSIGTLHLRLLRTMPEVEVVAITRRPGAREELRNAGTEAYASLPEGGGELDGVVVASRTGQHLSDLEKAAAAGVRAALVEKPLVPTMTDDVDRRLSDLSDHMTLHVGYCLRFDPGMAVFRQALEHIGTPHAIRAECRSYLPDWRPDRDVADGYAADPDEGGVLRDLSHELDYVSWIFGAPARLNARLLATGRLGIPTDDTAEILWATPAGATVTVGLDYLTRASSRRISAHGADASVTWDLLGRTVEIRGPDGVSRQEIEGPAKIMYRRQMEAFLGDDPDVLCTLAEGIRVVRICDAAREASRTGMAAVVRENISGGAAEPGGTASSAASGASV